MAYTLIFLLKNASSSHFFSKNICELDIVLTRTVNILLINELVKLMMLSTTGPGKFLNMRNFPMKYHNITQNTPSILPFPDGMSL